VAENTAEAAFVPLLKRSCWPMVIRRSATTGLKSEAKIVGIHGPIGLEIMRSRIRRGIEQLVKDGVLLADG
jgi:hypothetical protein